MFDLNECLLGLGHSRVPPTGCQGLGPYGFYQQSPALFCDHECPSVCLAGYYFVGGITCAHCHARLTLQLHFYGANIINHFVCEILSLLKLACSDTSLNELMISTTGIFTLLLPFGFVLLSYAQIATTFLRILSAQGRLKAFSTCGSHLTVVTVF